MRRIIEIVLNWVKSLFEESNIETIEVEPNDDDNTVVVPEPEDEPEIVPETGETDTGSSIIIHYTEKEEKPKKDMVVLLDNGHGKSTPGKRSPKVDGQEQFFEYEFNRDIVRRIAEKLSARGIKYEILVPEVENDISLSSRAARANKFVNDYGEDKCLFISVHANAAGNGSQWMNATGWSCYTSKGETASDPVAELFMCEAEKVLVPMGRRTRKYSQKKYSWEDNFTVLVKTKCRAILTENLFYDNKEDLAFLQSEEGRDAIAQIHVNAIEKLNNPDD